MQHRLFVYNPSNYPRGGWVTLRWQKLAEETGLSPEGLSLYQEGVLLHHQIDQLDPADPARDTLSFFLAKPIEPGDEHYRKPTGMVLLEGQKSNGERDRELPEQKSVLELSNSQLDIRLNLTPASEDNGGCWYAGSARSVRLEKLRLFEEDHRKEFLDYLKSQYSPYGHDPEKRCMQLEAIRLAQPGLRPGCYQKVSLYNQPYRLISECSGPVRKCVTIASQPFYYNYFRSAATDATPLCCELHRVFSLYQDREYVLEEIFLKTRPPILADRGEADIYFEARYFMYVVLGNPHYSRFENVPDWFAVGDLDSGIIYGFACDAHVGSVELPYPADPALVHKTNTVAWTLQPCKTTTCLHLFSRFKPTGDASAPSAEQDVLEQLADQMRPWFAGQAGHGWFEIIYKPLRAQLAAPGEESLSQGGAYVF